jgi:SAM-dependent methyltransferase
MTATAFDTLAPDYDTLWTNTPVGRLQREAVWRHCGHLFRRGETVLDLGCGTGEDALRLERRGVRVVATDSSPEMVRIARERGVDARLLRIEDAAATEQVFDGAISNFGAMNCVPRISDLREPLAGMIRQGGYLAICVMGRFCLWETAWYGLRGEFRRAARRWKGEATFGGFRVFYPRTGEIEKALAPDFILSATAGIGVCVPPSYVRGLSPGLLNSLGRMDSLAASWAGVRSLSDHRLMIFRRG